ncbi:MAG: RND transporter [bacterium]|nr:MAG: RND transporter [bacterium]
MKRFKLKTLIYLLPALALIILLGIRLYDDLSKTPIKKKATSKKEEVKVKTILAVKKRYTDRLNYFGNLEPLAKVDLYSKEESRISELYVDVADGVRKGQLVASLSDTELMEAKKQKEASLNTALANAKQNKVMTYHKKLIYDRARSAYREQVIPEQELDSSKADYDVAVAQYNLSRARVREAEALVQEMESRLGELKIYSPIDGVVAERYLDPGALVQPNQAILKILAIHQVKLIVSIAEQDINKLVGSNNRLRQDIQVSIYSEALKQSFKGKIYKIYPTMDTSTRTVKVEIRLNNPKRLLKPGFYCTARFNLGESIEALFLPDKAVNHDEVQKVYQVQVLEKGRVKLKTVGITPFEGDKYIINTGLSGGEPVIYPYNPKLKEGDSVSVLGSGV